jgi:hypothetical protein
MRSEAVEPTIAVRTPRRTASIVSPGRRAERAVRAGASGSHCEVRDHRGMIRRAFLRAHVLVDHT